MKRVMVTTLDTDVFCYQSPSIYDEVAAVPGPNLICNLFCLKFMASDDKELLEKQVLQN